MATISAQETTSAYCQQSIRNYCKLFSGSIKTFRRVWKAHRISAPEEYTSIASRSPCGYTGRHGFKQMKKSGESRGAK